MYEHIDFNGIEFITFDENKMTLSIIEGATSNDDVGIYDFIVILTESDTDLEK